jgi:hypothetical protein
MTMVGIAGVAVTAVTVLAIFMALAAWGARTHILALRRSWLSAGQDIADRGAVEWCTARCHSFWA